MKPILQVLLNIIIHIFYSSWGFSVLFLTGKLLRVSPYHSHSGKYRSPEKIREWLDDHFQSEACVSLKTVRQIERTTVEKIGNSKAYKEYLQHLDIPIYKRGEIVGTQSAYSVLVKSITEEKWK